MKHVGFLMLEYSSIPIFAAMYAVNVTSPAQLPLVNDCRNSGTMSTDLNLFGHIYGPVWNILTYLDIFGPIWTLLSLLFLLFLHSYFSFFSQLSSFLTLPTLPKGLQT